MGPDPAGDDELEGVEVRREVQREAVHGDPAREAHADRAELGELPGPGRAGPLAPARRGRPDADHP